MPCCEQVSFLHLHTCDIESHCKKHHGNDEMVGHHGWNKNVPERKKQDSEQGCIKAFQFQDFTENTVHEKHGIKS